LDKDIRMKIFKVLTCASLLFLFACEKQGQTEKDNEGGQSTELSQFVAGKGFTYLASYSADNGGGISFMNSLDISVTPDGKLHWLFSRDNPYANNAYLYRKVINASTGAHLSDGDLAVVGNQVTFNSYDRGFTDKFGFIPYSDKIYRAFRSGDAKFKVEGEIPTAEYGGYDGTAIKANFYTNGVPTLHFAWNIKANLQDINTRIGGYELRNGKMVAMAGVDQTMWSYGKASNFDKLYHGGMSFPTDLNGGTSAFGFTETKAYLFKKVGNGSVAIDSVGYPGIPFYTGSVVPQVPFVAKTSQDLKTTVLLCFEPDSYTAFSGKYVYSTFVINNTTGKIAIGVKQFAMAQVQVDVDLKGNIYYAVQPTTNTSAQVMKVSGQSQSVFASGFFTGFQQIRNLQVVEDKVYITALTSNEKTVSKISLFVSK
jgi:hypothetical protein